MGPDILVDVERLDGRGVVANLDSEDPARYNFLESGQ